MPRQTMTYGLLLARGAVFLMFVGAVPGLPLGASGN